MKNISFTLISVLVVVLALCCPASVVDAVRSQCKADTDCFPANCCHSSICVSKEHREHCDGKSCSAECVPFSMDCGGSCFCNAQNMCAAKLNNMTFGGGGGEVGPVEHKHKRYTYIHIRVKGWPKHHGHSEEKPLV